MLFKEYSRKIKSFGREICLDAITQTRDLIAPRLDSAPFADVTVQRDVCYGEHERHRLDIFTPESAQLDQRPLLIFVHGGGFVAGDKTMPGTPFFDNIGVWAVRNGFNAINMTYRLAPEFQWPSGIEDMHELIQFVKKHGSEYGVSANNIYLMGHSAGATHAAGYVAHPEVYAPDQHGITGLILLSGLYDHTSSSVTDMEKSYLGGDESRYGEMESIAGLLKSDIPIMMSAAESDPAFFEVQALGLLNALQAQRQNLPYFVHLKGQNHFSQTLYLGLEGDLLGPAIKSFIECNA